MPLHVVATYNYANRIAQSCLFENWTKLHGNTRRNNRKWHNQSNFFNQSDCIIGYREFLAAARPVKAVLGVASGPHQCVSGVLAALGQEDFAGLPIRDAHETPLVVRPIGRAAPGTDGFEPTAIVQRFTIDESAVEVKQNGPWGGWRGHSLLYRTPCYTGPRARPVPPGYGSQPGSGRSTRRFTKHGALRVCLLP